MALPWNESGEVGKDILANKYCCHPCYKVLHENAAKAAKEMSDTIISMKPE